MTGPSAGTIVALVLHQEFRERFVPERQPSTAKSLRHGASYSPGVGRDADGAGNGIRQNGTV